MHLRASLANRLGSAPKKHETWTQVPEVEFLLTEISPALEIHSGDGAIALVITAD